MVEYCATQPMDHFAGTAVVLGAAEELVDKVVVLTAEVAVAGKLESFEAFGILDSLAVVVVEELDMTDP